MYTFVCGHTMGFPDDSVVRNPPIDAEDMGLGELRELVMDKGGLACWGSWGRKESDTTE